MEKPVYHCLRYRGLAPLSCSDEFACHSWVMNGRKAAEIYCGLIRGGKVKSGLATCPSLPLHLSIPQHHGCDPLWMARCTFTYLQPAHQSAGWSASNGPQHQLDICFDKVSDSIIVSQGPWTQQIVSIASPSSISKGYVLKVRHSSSICTCRKLKSNAFDLKVDDNSLS